MANENEKKIKERRPKGSGIQDDELKEGEVTEAELEAETGFQGEIEAQQDDVAALKAELAALRAKSEEYLDGWQRERAEFANYKKRVDRERDQMKQNLTGDLIRRYLEVVDDLERALKNRPAQGEGATWAGGIELIYRKLLAILEAEGVERLQVEGELFDPNLHEAISQEPSDDHESGQVIEVIKNGYRLGERILRPAMVRVAQ
jgi:molecular chaperone GrpE